MKKILLSAALAASAFSYSSAQIAGYGFESRVGSYEEITDGTILDLSDLTDMDIYKKAFLKDGRVDGLATGEGMPIGFTFEYNGMQCDQFAVGSNGFVMVGDGSITINPSGGRSMFTYTTEGTSNLFGIIPNCDFTGVTSAPIISYKTIGEAPDRELVVQFSDYYISTTLWGDDLTPVDFQIRLCETTNDIEMIFNGWVAEEGKSYGIRIGIKGEPGQTQTLTSESGDFQNMSTTSSVNMVYFSSTSNVVDGLTYTFTAPMQCEMPASQATGLTMSSTSETIEGSFTPTDAAALFGGCVAGDHSTIPHIDHAGFADFTVKFIAQKLIDLFCPGNKNTTAPGRAVSGHAAALQGKSRHGGTLWFQSVVKHNAAASLRGFVVADFGIALHGRIHIGADQDAAAKRALVLRDFGIVFNRKTVCVFSSKNGSANCYCPRITGTAADAGVALDRKMTR